MTSSSRIFRAATRSAILMIAVGGFPVMLQAAPPTGPVITATKDDGVPSATRKLKGESVTYTNTISNTGTSAASNVQFADPDVTDTTVVAGSLKATPLALDDTYPQTVTPNIGVDSSQGSNFSVVANDFCGYNNGNALTTADLTISAYDAASANGGTVSMVTTGANIGKFTYQPPAGFTGTDTFTYTLDNGVSGGTTTSIKGTVSLSVSGTVVWFVNAATGNDSTGKGTLASPFKTIQKAATTAAASNSIFVYSGSYTAVDANGISLKTSQVLWGQGVTGASFDAVVLGSTPGSDSAARPSIGGSKPTIGNTTTDANVITLADGNTIRAVVVNSAAGLGKGIVGTTAIATVNTGTIGVSGDVSISGCPGGAFSLTGGSGAFNVGAIITNTAKKSVSISGRTGGTIAFSSAISDTGEGISLSSNSGATINFTGGLALTTFSATGGGTVSATQDNSTIVNTLSASTDTALNVANTTIGATGLTFRSISSGSGGSTSNVGISLVSTGNSGSLTVTGNGTAGSGGTIQRKAGVDGQTGNGIGIYLSNTKNPSFQRMQLNDFANFAIRGSSVNGLTVANCVINTTSGWNGSNDATPYNEGSVSFDELTGVVSITNTSIANGYADNFRVKNTTGSLNRITFDTVTIGANQSGAAGDGSQDHGNDGITIEALTGAATINASILNSTFTSSRGDLLQFSNNGTGSCDLILTNNTFTNNYTRIATGGGGVTVTSSGTADFTYNISGNSFRDAVGMRW
ncbi:MAG: Ig-like domain-containing protein [Luteolibacter sp.]